jgi:NAD(P)-dependent dehydrogenase (short-subunit alcohol dehydrogenase family)
MEALVISPPQAPRRLIQPREEKQMTQQKTFLVFGASGQTGQHFVSLALREGHKVRALVRHPAKLASRSPELEVHQGSITDVPNLDELAQGADFVISMLGDAKMQKKTKINTAFVQKLIPAMRRQGVKRFLYQAGGLSKPPNGRLSPIHWIIRNTVARGFIGQHEDNEAVMEYLVESASDVEWIVHRAGIGSNGPSKGVLKRSKKYVSIATFEDCATYNYQTLMDPSAIHTCDLSRYQKG